MEAQPALPTFEWPALVAGPSFLCFEMPGKPPHKGRHRSRIVFPNKGKPFVHMYPDPETAAHEKAFAELASLHMRGRSPTKEPCVMLVHAFCPIPESWNRRDKEKALAGAIVPTSRPDADNFLKFAKDSLNKIAYEDDSQVVDARCIKRYSDQPALRVEIRELVSPKI